MYQLDTAARETIATSLRDLRRDEDRPITIDGDVWVGGARDGRYESMHPAVAHREVVDAVLDHELVQVATREQDSTWEALKWLLSLGPLPHDVPATHRNAIEMAKAAGDWNSTK